MTLEGALTPGEHFDRLLDCAVRKDRGADLTADMGQPETRGEARRLFVGLRDFNVT